ncbi:acyl-CoA thioester hydrolase/BAAT C-terminal domain-containing protein [Enterococcus sp. CSURQ0835]|uniref:acyl-CoA thioester hydrolase/BAAT C-terminal domain-containing protein n=1 Tax=Enterococcus sp. CSURQ0835 TaxID=2681394 RepID=UPI0013594DBD|nr:acyl-CoA thioester hydrolase/BAAT C-terminal domain-containing protein [Enterococcus sp. CSURQ0835]
MVSITLISSSDLADEPFRIEVAQLPANQSINLKLTLEGYSNINAPMHLASTTIWRAEADFLANNQGRLVITEKSAMELFFNCQPYYKQMVKLAKNIKDIPLHSSFNLSITVSTQHVVLKQQCFRRFFQLPKVASKTIDLTGGKGRIFWDPALHAAPAILVLSGSDGRIEKAQQIAQLLASRGFATLAISYFGLEKTAPNLMKIPLELIESGIHYLASQTFVDSNRIGIYGRSKGAELALVSASQFSELKCVVVNSPMNAVLEGIKGTRNARASSWIRNGLELPYTKFKFSDLIKWKFFKQSFPVKPASKIPIEQIAGDILFLGSLKDEIWPTSFAIDQMVQQLSQSSIYQHQVKAKLYANCGHMMTIAYQPNHRYHKVPWKKVMADSNDSWQETIRFFAEHL